MRPSFTSLTQALTLTLTFTLALTGCSGETDDPQTTTDSSVQGFAFPDNTQDAIDTYAELVYANYSDALTSAGALDDAVTALVADPTAQGLDQAKTAWKASRVPYLQTEVFRFYEGPIDNADDGPEGLLNAWPLDELYIDYVVGDPTSGIINGTDAIDAVTLQGLNEVGGEKNIATGYHAVEFLLWGQDLSDTGPGERPYTDYVTDGTGTADNQARRGQYLTTVSALIETHLGQVRDQWAPAGEYRVAFEADAQGSFANILTGMIILSGFETGGERLQAALDSGDREDEHSCFSDNTKVDMVEDVVGVQNVWNGVYGSVSGTGIKDVVAQVDADLADQVTAQIQQSLTLANALQDPFENEIDPANPEGQARVQALIDSLRTQEGLLEDVFRTFELSIPVPE